MKKKKFKQLDEKKILSRLSNGDMGQILGGKSIDENELSPALITVSQGADAVKVHAVPLAKLKAKGVRFQEP